MKGALYLVLAGSSLAALSSPAFAQQQPSDAGVNSAATGTTGVGVEDIVVTARRKDELLQEVPGTINVVTADTLQKFNIRNFTDIPQLVPGLTLTSFNAARAQATVRGVQFDPTASGNNPTVEFYLDDAPIASNFLFQSTFDMGQFELLRGPQGTLRGRASPSGSITVTTKAPDLNDVGFVVNGTAADSKSYKGDVAFNLPLINDILALRLAGVYDHSDGGQVQSIKQWTNPYSEPPFRDTRAGRASLRFEPADFLSVNLMYQSLTNRNTSYGQVISGNFVPGWTPSPTNPALPSPGIIGGTTATQSPVIGPNDRLGIADGRSGSRQDQNALVGRIEVRLAGQKINYVGAYNNSSILTMTPNDAGDYYSASNGYPVIARQFTDPVGQAAVCSQQGALIGIAPTNGDYFQCTYNKSRRWSHEVRLSSEESIGGILDYTIGAFFDRNTTVNTITTETPLITAAPTTSPRVSTTPIAGFGDSNENSFFGNATLHLGKFEIAGGGRHIWYHTINSLAVLSSSSVTGADTTNTAWIYSGSLKYQFNDDIMLYGSVASSWRPGAFVQGDFNTRISPVEKSFINLPPETSTSYEVGIKSTFLNKKGRLNLTYYHQDFKNFAYYGATAYYLNYPSVAAAASVNSQTFAAAVPASVDGVEVDAGYQIMRHWDVGANFAYAKGRIKNGTIPCTDINGDGIPDTNPARPTVAQLQAVAGTNNLSTCSNYNGRTLNGPLWTLNANSEYGLSLNDWSDGFIRGLVTYSPSYTPDPIANSAFQVGSYALVNLFLGVRDPKGAWELSAFAKNLFDVKKVLTRGAAPLATSVQVGAAAQTFTSNYYSITMTVPREVGISLRYSWGAR